MSHDFSGNFNFCIYFYLLYKNIDDVIFVGVCTTMLSYVWRIWFEGQGISVATQCLIFNSMLWNVQGEKKKLKKTLQLLILDIVCGHIVIILTLLVSRYKRDEQLEAMPLWWQLDKACHEFNTLIDILLKMYNAD